MSRNGSGTYAVPNTFTSGTPITAADHNENWTDLATEMTNSVAADGQTSMTGQFKAANGTILAPGITFASDLNTGFYRIGSDNLGAAVGGIKALDLATTGVSILGSDGTASAAAGYVGEYVEGEVLIGSAFGLTSGVKADITSISLTAGDWDVWGTVGVTPGLGNPGVTNISGWIHTVSATEPTDPNKGAKVIHYHPNAGSDDGKFAELPGLRRRLLITSTTTVYLTITAGWSGGSLLGYGFLAARRFR